jgi:hypothetical protein
VFFLENIHLTFLNYWCLPHSRFFIPSALETVQFTFLSGFESGLVNMVPAKLEIGEVTTDTSLSTSTSITENIASLNPRISLAKLKHLRVM